MDMVAAVLAGSMAVSGAVQAQGVQSRPPADALRGCLADNTSGRDRKDLAKWIFLAMAAHPEMKQLAGAGAAAAGEESSKVVAGLVTRLLTNACAKEAKAVMAIGDAGTAMKLAFEGLGQLAMAELMTDKAVEEAMGGFARYLDRERFTETLTPR